jgi:hypothetical protein
MRLKAIFETQENEEYKNILNGVREKFGEGERKYLSVRAVSEEGYSIENRYGTNVYKGKLKEGVKITELELSMICDNLCLLLEKGINRKFLEVRG